MGLPSGLLYCAVRIGIISDIHGNLIALEACIQAIRTSCCDKVISLGDDIGYYPDAVSCLALLESERIISLLGNHEAMFIGRKELEPEKDDIYQISSIQGVPQKDVHAIAKRMPVMQLEVAGKEMLFLHGSPWDPLCGYIYPDDDNVHALGQFGMHYIFMGHTHRAFVCKFGTTTILNVGSVGLPRDNGSRGVFALLDTDKGEASLKCFDLPVNEIVEKYKKVHPSVIETLYRK